LLDHVRELGGYFRAQLEWLKAKHSCIREVRGMGLMLGLELESADTAKAVVSVLLKNNILINRTHETVLRFLPPYIIQERHVNKVVQALDSALTSVASKRRHVATRAVVHAHKPTSKESQ
jgi:acetylornithine/N-succinyldiaminopimelate aminotransferase